MDILVHTFLFCGNVHQSKSLDGNFHLYRKIIQKKLIPCPIAALFCLCSNLYIEQLETDLLCHS